MSSLSRVAAITFKELRQLRRDRLTFGMVVMIPLIQLLLFGFAINTNVRHLPAGLVDLSHSSVSHILVDSIRATQVVDFVHRYHSLEAAERAITRGDIRAALLLPADLAKRMSRHPLIAVIAVDPLPADGNDRAPPESQSRDRSRLLRETRRGHGAADHGRRRDLSRRGPARLGTGVSPFVSGRCHLARRGP